MAVYTPKDITGKRYGKLTAIQRTPKREKNGAYIWLCKCDCGNYVNVSIANLRDNGGTRSCGCKRTQYIEPIQEYEKKKRLELASVTSEWEYVRCYDRAKSRHIIKCCYCGTERKTENLTTLPTCKTCLRIQRKQEEEQSKYKECVVCGSLFRPQKSTALYCSSHCKGKAKRLRHIDKVREREKINKRLRETRAKGNGEVDYSITLARLIERDNHICQLCGREVNESDYVYKGDYFIAGNDYPSIDHIKPLSKGGVHQWSNVQLAHRLCNSIKCDKEKII